jgi:hypothetical protein
MVSKFHMLVPSIRGSAVWNWLRGSFLAPRFLKDMSLPEPTYNVDVCCTTFVLVHSSLSPSHDAHTPAGARARTHARTHTHTELI